MKRLILLIAALVASSAMNAQVISSLDDASRGAERSDANIISDLRNGTIEDLSFAADSIIFNWTKELNPDMERSAELQAALDKASDTAARMNLPVSGKASPAALLAGLPHLYDEQGIDLFMLTEEGIYIYSMVDSPVYQIEVSDEVVKWVRLYAYDRRDYTKSIFRRYAQWEPALKAHLAKNGVPQELAELVLVESGCTSTAVSQAGAVGMWQIMPETGRGYGMVINSQHDDRKDPWKSTVVATKILLNNYHRLGDWTFATAAYNCGAGRMMRYVSPSRHSVWEAVGPYLPKETRAYIPRLCALHYVWKYRADLGLL